MRRLSALRGHKGLRYARIGLAVGASILAVAIVLALTIDLGPAVRTLAEEQGSTYLKRPVHIGRLSVHLLSGRVIVEDFSIEGLHPTDRPFFTARHLAASLDWSTVFGREVTIASVEMTDWQMLVETWENLHNFPEFTNNEDDPERLTRFTTTLKYFRAWRGQFTFVDHEAPWSIVAPNLDINIGNLPQYHGTATFTGGTVAIQDYVPFLASMKASFVIDGGRVYLNRIDLDSDGATTVASGDVDIARWPEQTYHVKSRVHFPRMRELFFRDETFRLTGDGDFAGTFHLFKGGRDLAGTFSSQMAGVNAYRFPALYGALHWTQTALDVTDAGSKLYGGDARFTYSIKPLGAKVPPTARFEWSHSRVDLVALTDFEELDGLRFAGHATGEHLLEWPLGRFVEHRGGGHLVVEPPPGVEPMTASLAAARADADPVAHEGGPFAPIPLPAHLPISGELTYRFDPVLVQVQPSRFATEKTHVTFQGSTEWGDRSHFAFHVVSRDWQESDQVLAGILTNLGSPTGVVTFGGRGEFDGTLTGAFRRPRVEGEFSGDDLRAWDTLWGAGSAHLAVENRYVRVTDGVVRLNDSEIQANGLFSLGYPRDDGREEMNARFRVARRDLAKLRHAFGFDEYPVSGELSGEFQLAGQYERPIGFGGMTIDHGVAYGEPFQKAAASLRFDGPGVRLDGVEIAKSSGTITGTAFVGWDSTYSFNAGGRRIPLEGIAAFSYPRTPLSGLAEFSAGGSGTFDQPRYDVKFRVDDLFIADEEVGQVTGSLARRGKELSVEIAAASPRLAITGTGRIALTPQADSEIAFRFHDSSLDPYVRLFVPSLSPFTTAVASGSVRIVGELTDVDNLLVDGTVDTLDLRLFDYGLKNATPIRLALDQHEVRVADLQLVGDETRLRVSGTVDLHEQRIALRAVGDVNLGILQGFLRNVRGAGRAELTAAVDGPLHEPVFSGRATIVDGRIRHFSLPNSLDSINGTAFFDARGIRLDSISATMGGGRVQFGGRVGFEGYLPGELNVTARGEGMHLRYPEGVRSVVDADLSVHGNFKSPTLAGTVTVKSAVWTKRIDTPVSILDLVGRRSSLGGGAGGEAGTATTTVPLAFDLQILVPSTLQIDNNLLRMVVSADLALRGTYDRPVLAGHAEIERGDVVFEGRRYRLTRGTIDFNDPTRIEPFFDVEAETTVRVPGQTYRMIVSAAGTSERFQPSLNSDPPLPMADALALLFSDVRRNQDVELRALQNPNQTQTDILTTRATQALASPLSAEVGKVVEQTFGVDTFQLSPSFVDPYSEQTSRLNPTARLTIGKRFSDRVYLTFSRSLGTTINDQIILLEYDASDRLSWLLSRNEDQTYALEFRVRHKF